jgi:Ca2+-binding EF-hand superfamily protein
VDEMLANPTVNNDGKCDEMSIGIPHSWEFVAKQPPEGVFRGLYVCAPEDRIFKLRKELLSRFGHWEMDTLEHEVMWWAGLREAPEDVISYIEFLMPRYASVESAFDGVWARHCHSEDRGINLHVFESSIDKMDCKKFEAEKNGLSKHERIKSVFRFMDSSQEGEVSRGEWSILGSLWNEFELCIDEFEKFVHRTFHGSLRLAWDFFDEDGSGEITLDEFKDAVHKVGYFGPVKETFHCIDENENGFITFNEWEDSWNKVKQEDIEEHDRRISPKTKRKDTSRKSFEDLEAL